jgi:PAS domain S-box-containing protein
MNSKPTPFPDPAWTDEESREYLGSFFNLSSEMLASVGRDGFVKCVNEACIRVLGWKRGDFFTRPALDFVHPDDRGAAREIAGEIREGRAPDACEIRCLCKDGSVRSIHWTHFGWSRDRGTAYAIGADVTGHREEGEERDAVRRELRSAQKQLRSLEKLLTICIHCRKVRNEVGNWDSLEHYIARRIPGNPADDTCPDCRQKTFRRVPA